MRTAGAFPAASSPRTGSFLAVTQSHVQVGMSFPPTLRSPEPPEPPELEGALGGCLPPGHDDALI